MVDVRPAVRQVSGRGGPRRRGGGGSSSDGPYGPYNAADSAPVGRRGPAAAQCRGGRSSRTTATSSVSSPAVQLAGLGDGGVEQFLAAQARGQQAGGSSRTMPSWPSRCGALADPALDQAVGVEHQTPVAVELAPGCAATARRPADRARDRPRRTAAGPGPGRARRAAAPDDRRGAGPAGARPARCRRVHSVAKISSSARSCSSTCWSVRSRVSPRSPAKVSARQAIRSSTPSAASSGPWPQTSPIMACTVPSGVRTVS